MAKIITATVHDCAGIGELVTDGKIAKVTSPLGLRPTTIALQHIETGATRPICEHLENDNYCTKLRDATKEECLVTLGLEPYSNKEFNHIAQPCKWVKPAIK